MPSYIVLGMVNHEACTGRRDLSPFNFQHYDVKYLALCQNGRQVPSKPFQPQFNQRNCVREFHNLFTATGRHFKDQPLSIVREDFNRGYSLFVFNLNSGRAVTGVKRVSTIGDALQATATQHRHSDSLHVFRFHSGDRL